MNDKPLPLVRLDDLEDQTRMMLRLIGPRVSAAEDERFTFSRCIVCSPPEKTYECFICRLQFNEDHWRYKMHVDINPETCQRYAKRWADSFASKV